MLFASLSAAAQEYTPHELWPFIYEDFAPAEVLLSNGERVILDAANINVADGKLYFVQNDTVKVTARMVTAASIQGDNYISAMGRLMKALRRTKHGAVLFDAEVDHEAMTRDDVGYGFKSSVSAVDKRNILEGANGATMSLRMEQQPLELLKMHKNGGEPLALKEVKYVFLYGGYTVRAIKSDVRNINGLDKKKLNAFWKENKVKYSDDDSLAALVEFIAGSLQPNPGSQK